MVKSINVKIKDKDYLCKLNLGALEIWENFMNKSHTELSDRITHMMAIHWSMLKFNNENFEYNYQEYVRVVVTEMENDNNIFQQINKYFIDLRQEETKTLQHIQPKKKVQK